MSGPSQDFVQKRDEAAREAVQAFNDYCATRTHPVRGGTPRQIYSAHARRRIRGIIFVHPSDQDGMYRAYHIKYMDMNRPGASGRGAPFGSKYCRTQEEAALMVEKFVRGAFR